MTWRDGKLVGFNYELVHELIHEVECKPEIIVEPDKPINYKIDFGKITRKNSYCVYCNSFTKCRGRDKTHKICLKCYLSYRTYGHLDRLI